MSVTSTLLFNWTVSSKDATSYASLDIANSYFLRRVNSDNWQTAAEHDDSKAVALMTATRAIDSYPGMADSRFENYHKNQRIFFPRWDIPFTINYAESSTDDTLVDSELAELRERPNDFWKLGSIIIVEGTGINQIRDITEFDSATGTITVSANWDTNPDTTSKYQLVAKITHDIIEACCEIAYLYMPDKTTDVIKEGSALRQRVIMGGVEEFRAGKHSEKFRGVHEIAGYLVPIKARNILDRYLRLFA